MIRVALTSSRNESGKRELVAIVEVPEKDMKGPIPRNIIWCNRLFVGALPYTDEPGIRFGYEEDLAWVVT